MDEGDPFGSLIKRCQPTNSQEDVLRTCPFARESEFLPDGESLSSEPFGIPVESTGIVMVSLPESPRDDSTPHEDFQTPPEDSLPASSEEQRPPAAAVDVLAGPQFDRVGGGETTVLDEGCTDSEKAVDLGKDSDNLGFSGVKLTQVIYGGVLAVDSSRGVDGVVATEVLDSELEKFMVLPRESSLVCDDIPFESVSKKQKFSDEIFEGFEPPRARTSDNEPVITDTNSDKNASTEVIDLEVEEIGEELGEDTMNVDLPLKETEIAVAPTEGQMHKNGNGGSARKNIEDLDKFKYVNPSGLNRSQKVSAVGGRRELPSSISGQAKNAGGEAGPDASAAKNQILKDLLDALKMVAGELDDGSEEDIDFLETAKRRGMTFPRPRWWPPEGYDD